MYNQKLAQLFHTEENNQGFTPLDWAASTGHFGVVQNIMKYIEDYHPKDNDGETPLYVAAENGHLSPCIQS